VSARTYLYYIDGDVIYRDGAGYLGFSNNPQSVLVENSVFDQPLGTTNPYGLSSYNLADDSVMTIRDTEVQGGGAYLTTELSSNGRVVVDNLTVRGNGRPASLVLYGSYGGEFVLNDVYVTGVVDNDGIDVLDMEAEVTMTNVLIENITNGYGLNLDGVNQDGGTVQTYQNLTVRDVTQDGVYIENAPMAVGAMAVRGVATFDGVRVQNTGENGFELVRDGHINEWEVTISNAAIDTVGEWGINANSISPQTDATNNVTTTNAGSGGCTGNVAC
jgi:hypothetical protein